MNRWVGRYTICGVTKCMWLEKKHDDAQEQYCICYSEIKKNVLGERVIRKKLKRGLQARRLKKWGWVWDLQAAISNKAKMNLSQNINQIILVRFLSTLYHQTQLLMTSQNLIHDITDITYIKTRLFFLDLDLKIQPQLLKKCFE